MANDLLQQAIKEAYVSASPDVIIYDTLELLHDDIRDTGGNKLPIRMVKGKKDIKVTLEAGADLDGGKEVTFSAIPFKITLPKINDKSAPVCQVQIDNINREIMNFIEKITFSTKRMKIVYRVYISTDLKTPQYNPPFSFYLKDITANVFSLVGKAVFLDLANLKFPTEIYKSDIYKGLS